MVELCIVNILDLCKIIKVRSSEEEYYLKHRAYQSLPCEYQFIHEYKNINLCIIIKQNGEQRPKT